MPDTPSDSVRSLADDLRQRSDDQLGQLLSLRPDLLHPVPPDLTALVSRASTSVATARALDRLDTWTLQVAEVLAALPDPTTVADLVAAIGPELGPSTEEALQRLRARALVWGSDDDLHLVRAVREAVGSWPAGLHPAGLSTLTSNDVLTLMHDAPAEARAVVDQLLWGPPIGSVPAAQRDVTVASARTPVEWLLARRLLVPIDTGTVALPREVALPLRGGAMLRSPAPHEPAIEPARASDLKAVNRTAGQSAFTLVRQIEDLLEHWALDPPPELRSGGLGVRELTATARLLDVEEPTAALIVELAHASGLLASDEDERPSWLPTASYDTWLSHDVAERWALIATAWFDLPRLPALVGERDDRSGRVNALTSDVERPDAPAVRRLVLDVVAGAPDGAAVTADQVRDVVVWRRPRRTTRARDVTIESTMREAELLGVTGIGALSTPGRTLLAVPGTNSPARGRRTPPIEGSLAASLAPLLPTPLDHVLLQADLTAVAPGPLESSFARELALLADVESTGGATVYRLSAESLRRAFDAGRSAHDVQQFLEQRSRTPVPQPLAYLVDDVARRHGVVRVGVAQSYVRCDDEATITAVLTDRRAAGLRPSRLAPGVLALQVPVDEALTVLRSLGLAPAAEAPDGSVVVRRRDSRRTLARPRQVHPGAEPSAPDALLVSAAVKALRAGDRITTRSRRRDGPERLGTIPLTSATDTIAGVRAAITEQRSIWIGYADTDGRATERVIDPIEISRGFLTAYDHRYEEVRSFALARITGVAAHEANE